MSPQTKIVQSDDLVPGSDRNLLPSECFTGTGNPQNFLYPGERRDGEHGRIAVGVLHVAEQDGRYRSEP